jgi:CRP-like cAMP-binding protein
VTTRPDDLIDTLASITLFGDLSRAQLERVARTFAEQWFSEGERILRQGITGSSFYVIIEGEAAVDIDGERRTVLAKGDHFGEISILLDEPPSADVTATRAMRCLVLGAPDLAPFLLDHPAVMLRLLQAGARRLRTVTR